MWTSVGLDMWPKLNFHVYKLFLLWSWSINILFCFHTCPTCTFCFILIYLHCALHHSSALLFFFGFLCSSLHFNVVVYILIVMFAFWCYSYILLQLSMFGLFDHIHASSSFFLLLCSLSLCFLHKNSCVSFCFMCVAYLLQLIEHTHAPALPSSPQKHL
jgi:hypothetical protein